MKLLALRLNVVHQKMVVQHSNCVDLGFLIVEIFSLAKENALLQSTLLDYELQLESNQRYRI